MKDLLKSPAHFKASAETFRPASPAMKLGTAAHCRILEPEIFASRYVSTADGRPKTKDDLMAELTQQGITFKKSASKPELEALLYPDGAPKDKRERLDAKTWEQVHNMWDALRFHDLTSEWFDPGIKAYRKHNEVSIYILNPQGQVLKGRFDRLHSTKDGKLQIVDLKTTKDSSPREFSRTATRLSYDLQAAWYTELATKAFPGIEVEFVFCVVETEAPHGINVFKASENFLSNGRKKMAKALDLHAQCVALDYWPGYEPEVHVLEPEPWARVEDNEDPAF